MSEEDKQRLPSVLALAVAKDKSIQVDYSFENREYVCMVCKNTSYTPNKTTLAVSVQRKSNNE